MSVMRGARPRFQVLEGGVRMGGMATVKEEARQLVERLPENATWKDLLYEIYVRQKLDDGRQAVAEERVVPHEEVKRRFLDR